MEKYVFIYTLEDPISNIVRYIGKTNNLKVRYSNHLSSNKKITYKSNWIFKLRKNGLKPIIKVLDVVPETEWRFWEMRYIALFKSWEFPLVNGTLGGDGNNGIAMPVKAVNCFTLKGDLLKSFKSIKSAATYYKCSSSHIVDCCTGKIRSYKNKIWRYSTDSFEKYCVKHKKKKVIVQYNLDWEIIREFESITAASEYLKCKPTSISRVLRGERKKFHKTYFKYKDIV